MPRRDLAAELLEKLLKGEISKRRQKNVVQARSFSELLEKSVNRYQNRTIQAAQVIEELIGLAKEMRQADRRGQELGLSDDEFAFYTALEVNDTAVAVLGEPTLRMIARELVEAIRNNVTIDWTVRENVRAHLRYKDSGRLRHEKLSRSTGHYDDVSSYAMIAQNATTSFHVIR